MNNNVVMKAKDTLSAKLAECFITIGNNRYNFMQMINFEAQFEKTKTEVVEYSASASPTEADLDALIYRIQSKLMDIRDISEINGYYDYDITQLKQLQFSQKILQKYLSICLQAK